jgi:foldase protein PrsA
VTKKILAVLVVLLLAATVGLVVGCGGNLPKDAVAKVGSTIITQKAFDQRVADFEAQYASTGQIPDKTSDPANYKLFQQDVLEYMITYQLASQAAVDLKITVADVQKEIDTILTDQFGGDQTKFDAALAQQSMTLDQLKESVLMQKVYDGVTKGVTTVADADIQAYYDANKTAYYVAETRTARHILLTPVSGRVEATTSTTTTSSTTSTTAASTTGSSDASSSTTSDTATATASSSTTTTSVPTQADWDSALEAAKLVRAQLVAGADWATEAKAYSDDPGSKATGGDLGGPISKGQMVQEFEDSVFSLKKDEISEPVKSAYGYHIIQVTGITEAKQYTLAEVKDDITSTLLDQQQRKAWQDWVTAQKAKVGVVYASAWATTTTTTAAPTVTTAGAGDTTTTAAGSADTATTAAPSSDTTAAPSTTTTAGATLTTAGATSTTAGQ